MELSACHACSVSAVRHSRRALYLHMLVAGCTGAGICRYSARLLSPQRLTGQACTQASPASAEQ